ncbi:SDR family NAD(P)-dependent oxidoreductase [Ruixingdingia sedimenti]|uniref:SDR family oxidoreductase n=1 Tax=Ruixingdingia sedimenti TaxID=3073604 RepID=A0ABU1FD30_9RHOB|nr:SDR family oxidoreductase [Xinfangfangia sp. LG-4]MDR5654795.1 SDR family oxidoreductase [Xinfangfangia sp. LG-4]
MTFAPTDLSGRTAVVTGAGQGIGFAIAGALTAAGAHVVAVDRDAGGRAALAADPRVTFVQGDVTDAALPPLLDEALDRGRRRLDILVNNAGIGRGGHALVTGDEDFRQFLDVNLVGLFRLSRWAVGRMIGTGGGAIVNTASIFGEVGAQNTAGYSASKAGVIGLTRQMATDYGPNGIRVNAVAPGLIETPLVADRIRSEPWRRHVLIDGAALRRVGQPVDIARAVRFLASDEAGFITGQILHVDGGWANCRFPRETPISADE